VGLDSTESTHFPNQDELESEAPMPECPTTWLPQT